MLIKIVIAVGRVILHTIARVKTVNFDRIPPSGGAIIVTNHLGRLDAMLAFLLIRSRPDVLMLIAEKYQKSAIWRWLARELNAMWLNRFDADYSTMRQVIRRLNAGEIMTLAPEGTRSKSEAMAPGKPGAAFLAAKTGLPLVPIALWGTEDRVVKERLRRLRRLDITVSVGQTFHIPPMTRHNRDEFLQAQTDEIMCHIAMLLPAKYRGYYADHPRLKELLAPPANGRVTDPAELVSPP
jgi:1-acyl-sn-glycerol-3-phosphate acyltransferase